VITFDRPGWGASEAPDDYRKTSIAEQAIAAAGVLRDQQVERARVLGIGFGAVIALELALAEPDRVESAVLFEPPLLDTSTRATEGMSIDVAAIREAAEEGGEKAVWELFLSGGLPTLGAGAGRLKEGSVAADGAGPADDGPAAPHTLLVELPAVPAWSLDPVRVAAIKAPVTVATALSTPALLVEAADALVPRIPGARRSEVREYGASGVVELVGRMRA
jgi:pimeloyl-ACP methyl ester carboxylesterase